MGDYEQQSNTMEGFGRTSEMFNPCGDPQQQLFTYVFTVDAWTHHEAWRNTGQPFKTIHSVILELIFKGFKNIGKWESCGKT